MYDINPWWFFSVPVYAIAYTAAQRYRYVQSIAATVSSKRLISPIFVLSSSRVRIDPGKRKFVIIITFCLFFFLEKSSEMLIFSKPLIRPYVCKWERSSCCPCVPSYGVWCVCIRKQKTCGGACVCLLKAFRATAVH